MKNISNIIMQETPPKMTNVGWLKPEKNKVVLKFFINGKWTTVDTGDSSEVPSEDPTLDINVVSYGIQWEIGTNNCTRVGNLELHKTLPIQSKLRGCVAKGSDIQYYLKDSDWNYKEDGSASRLDGYDGNVCVDTQAPIYFKSFINETTREMRISEVQVDETWHKLDRRLIFAYAPALLREVPSDMGYLSTLPVNSWVSIVNTNTYCRGGTNDSSFDQYLETDVYKTMLGKPSTNITRANARTYARQNNQTLLDYETYKVIFYWLPIIEYNTFDLDQPFNSELTSEGYHQGGIAPSFSLENHNSYNNSTQLPKNGDTNEFGNNTGCKELSNELGTFYSFRYRGLENIKNWLYWNLDGILCKGSEETITIEDTELPAFVEIYTSNDPSKFDDVLNDSYKLTGKTANGIGGAWISEITLGDSGEIIPESGTTLTDPNSPEGKGDGYGAAVGDSTTLFLALLGGDPGVGAIAGVSYFDAGYAYVVGYASPVLGFRVFQNLN